MKCVLLRVNESKPPNFFRIMSDYLICNDPADIYWQGHRKGSSEAMWGHHCFLANKSRYDGVKDLQMVPYCSPGHDASIGTQRDIFRSNFEVDQSRSLYTMLFVMHSGDLSTYWPDPKTKLFTKVVGLSTNYQMPFAVCRYDACFFRSDGGQKDPRPIPSLSEPARNRVEFQLTSWHEMT